MGARRGGGESLGISENTSQQFILALDYFAFRIELDTLLHYTFSVQTRGKIAISRQLIMEVPNYFAFVKKCLVAHIPRKRGETY